MKKDLEIITDLFQKIGSDPHELNDPEIAWFDMEQSTAQNVLAYLHSNLAS